MLKSVWTIGVRLPWPINNKVDIGRLPKPRPEPTPPNAPVKEWAEAIANERDPYLRLVWLLIAQHGWRPSHAVGVRWSDVQYDEQSHPYSIISSGAGAVFKSYAPVAVRLAPDVVRALEEWAKIHPDPNGNAFILPYRGLRAELDATRQMRSVEFRYHWLALQKKYGLPKLTSKSLRHWVSTQCRKAGLSKRASAYLQGHDADGGSSMRDWYDNVPIEEIFLEQGECFPNGPLATVLPMSVELIPDIPPEAVSLLSQFLSGELDSYEFMPLIVNVRKKMDQPARMTV
jgi:integrase